MRATGRTRYHLVVSGRRSSMKSWVIGSLLSDDTSVRQQSEVRDKELVQVKEVLEEEEEEEEEKRDGDHTEHIEPTVQPEIPHEAQNHSDDEKEDFKKC